ncbi:MAG: hypothetical protein II998_12880 [Clostridia bacterium]|nr:hypothetical protein [Clostridia bacterium]
MVVKKVCPYCKCSFNSRKNAKVFCRKRCAELAKKRVLKENKSHMCQWCAKKFRSPEYRRKFCSESCRCNFVTSVMVMHCKKRKRPVKRSLEEVIRCSREAGLSYGVYVGINGID